MGTTKLIHQEISKKLYDELHNKPISIMRSYVRNYLVPRHLWSYWYGCSINKLNNKYYLHHRVDINFNVNYLEGGYEDEEM